MPMTRSEAERLEKVSGQMEGIHGEIGVLNKKSPNDGVNKFKLKLINAAVGEANAVLGKKYKPYDDFDKFEEDDLPSNSDVTFIVGQYIEALERKRADSIKQEQGRWVYILSDSAEPIRTAAPKKLASKK
jgi:hypothetical protein